MSYGQEVTERSLQRLPAVAGGVACLAVGISVMLDQFVGDGDLVSGPLWVWWPAFVGYVSAFLVISASDMPPQSSWAYRLLTVQTLLGAVVYAMTARFGWTSVLLVITAITAAYVLPLRGTVALVVGQTVFIAVVSAAAGFEGLNLALSVLVYASFQAFGVLLVLSELREAEARMRLVDANAQLRAATVLLDESSRVTERLRIARDLHDLIGHQLTALSLELEVASHHHTSPAAEHVSKARRIAKELLADVRLAVGELRTPTPGLQSALTKVADDLSRPQVHLQVPEDLQTDEERTLTLIRCVQEIVTNAVRHADAEHLWIDISATPGGGTRLDARDDGRGAQTVRPGHGLTGIRERIEQLGGEVWFDSRPGQGFGVCARLPART